MIGKLFGFVAGRGMMIWLYAAGITIMLAAITGAYVKGRVDCKAKVSVAQTKADLKATKASLKVVQADGEQALKDYEVERKIEDMADAIHKSMGTTPCYTREQSDRMRDLWDN